MFFLCLRLKNKFLMEERDYKVWLKLFEVLSIKWFVKLKVVDLVGREVRFYGDVFLLIVFLVKFFRIKGFDFFFFWFLRKLRELFLEVFVKDLYLRLFFEFILRDFLKRLLFCFVVNEDGELMIFY